ncbi:hypothetical protein N431DRAFT_442133 [Stipitochalara longipes BDJ]|nr:hypothetical protein N431DRAFT_442133 [Stipitochalara longipes BDJ]
MCLYIPIRHACGCTTIKLPRQNPCRLAFKNCMPCPYIPEPASRPGSLSSAPGLSTSSTISGSSFSTGLVSKYQQSITYKEEDAVRVTTICPFHAEDWEETYRVSNGLEEGNVGAKTVRKAREQRDKREREWLERLKTRVQKRKRESTEGVSLGVWRVEDGEWASWYGGEDRWG